MSASTYLLGNGSVFSISTDGTAFVPVKEMQKITLGGSKKDTSDITNLDSVGRYREFASTLRDAGQCTLSGIFVPTDPGQVECTAAFDSDTYVYCKLQLPPFGTQTTGVVKTFNALVTERPNIEISTDKEVTFSATLKITGPITDVAGS